VQYSELFEQILQKRKYGVTHLLLFEREAGIDWERQLVDRTFAEEIFSWDSILSYRKDKQGHEQRPISGEEVLNVLEKIEDKGKAKIILTILLHKDMAYDSEMMSLEEAEELAERFLSYFSDTARYYSNSEWKKKESTGTHHLNSWDPLTDATFDSGLIIIDEKQIGITWFEDED
jgi:hypothetical protein